MSALVATIVDVDALLKVVYASFIAGVGAALVFSLAISGAARFLDCQRDGDTLGSVIFGALAVAGTLATLALVAAGLIVMVSKG